jgi:hypothetical protein
VPTFRAVTNAAAVCAPLRSRSRPVTAIRLVSQPQVQIQAPACLAHQSSYNADAGGFRSPLRSRSGPAVLLRRVQHTCCMLRTSSSRIGSIQGRCCKQSCSPLRSCSRPVTAIRLGGQPPVMTASQTSSKAVVTDNTTKHPP